MKNEQGFFVEIYVDGFYFFFCFLCCVFYYWSMVVFLLPKIFTESIINWKRNEGE